MPARPRPPSASSITPASPQDRRSARRRRDDGLDGAGAGARHHDHVGCDDVLLERNGTGSTSSTRPATSTSPSKSSVRCACSTARLRCSTATQGVEPQTETVWRQADKYNVPRMSSSTRWTRPAPISTLRRDRRPPRRPSARHPAADRRRDRLQGRRRPRRDERDSSGATKNRWARSSTIVEIPADLKAERREVPPRS
jgi:hypothetical protein